VGLYALIFSSIWPESKIHCFEPIPINSAVLKKHIKKNKLGDRVFVVEKAVWHMSKQRLHLGFPNNRERESANTGLYTVYFRKSPSKFVVETISLDDFCSENKVQPDFIKMDTEGSEERILAGGYITLRNTKSVIVEKSRNRDFPPHGRVTFHLVRINFRIVNSHKNDIWVK